MINFTKRNKKKRPPYSNTTTQRIRDSYPSFLDSYRVRLDRSSTTQDNTSTSTSTDVNMTLINI
jgi:hypothetical protein